MYRIFSSIHYKDWGKVEGALSSIGKIRLNLYLSSCGAAKKSDIIEFMMRTGQYDSRASCVRAVNRYLEEMMEKKSIEMDEDGNISLQKKTELIVGKYPGSWIVLGLGASIIFMGLGYMENDMLLIICASAFLIYSAAVVLDIFLRLSPY